MKNVISIKGARENNLKNISINIPKNKLVIITGLSGSGKSSLAFDTIYAEGKRRYLESLSSYARQFLGNNDKPDVDSIEGLSPTIAIDQKTINHNPRSTVGTITEIYDYFRVLFARIGTPHCPRGHGIIKTQTIKQIVSTIMGNNEKSRLIIMAPIANEKKGSFAKEIDDIRKKGFLRIRLDGTIIDLDEEFSINKNEKHNIELVVDRIILNHDNETRQKITSSIELALRESSGSIIVNINDNDYCFNINYACDKCGFSLPELEPRLFSFNSPLGACDYCKGLGFTYEPSAQKIIPNPKLSIFEGGIDYFKNTVNTENLEWQKFKIMLDFYKIDIKKPIEKLTEEELNIILHGSHEPIEIRLTSTSGNTFHKIDYIEGIADSIKRKHHETSSELAREFYNKYMMETKCKKCLGKKLNENALCVLINDKNIIDITDLCINDVIDFLLNLKLTNEQKIISDLLLKEISNRLGFLQNVGLDYLNLSRLASTLSGGESQRTRLATQIGSHLTGVLYVLDEPSIGLHQKDNDMLLETLKSIRDLGNTLIVVEHDEDTMRKSDYLIDIGPGAGSFGGNIVAAGSVEDVMKNEESITGQYLSGKKVIDVPKKRRGGNGYKLVLKGAKGNNLKNINVTIPLNKLVVVTGVSGSGKSSLIMQTLVKAIEKNISNPFVVPLPYTDLIGCHHLDKIIVVTQEPIGRTPRSNPATYIGLFNDIRDLFAMLPEAKARGYLKGRFSFNVKGGRCEHCQGDGVIKIEMHFLPDVYVKCSECNGQKYNDETLQIRYKGKNIYDILELSVVDALEFFKDIPNIYIKIKALNDVGLSYLKLGASSTTLSGGEAQRIKLAKYLQKKPTGKSIYVLDEPTTGLHFDDVNRLIKILNRIVDNGDTVLVVEHNLDLIKVADHIIDIGPDGGNHGGEIIATGTPEQICDKDDISYTAKYLKKLL